ncbi:hypothetical protein SDC9_101901 [bioreactor metagenome]|uniref:Uncharacterized protein n=1 Tax=bioreactor metagenome TaxID=1076179 RepID=A0A645AQD4_9ZZZZ
MLDESRAETLLLLDFHAVEDTTVAVEADEKVVLFGQRAHFLQIISHFERYLPLGRRTPLRKIAFMQTHRNLI